MEGNALSGAPGPHGTVGRRGVAEVYLGDAYRTALRAAVSKTEE